MHEENSLIIGKTRGRGCTLVRTHITRIIGSADIPISALVQNNRRTDIATDIYTAANEQRLAVHCKSKHYITRSHMIHMIPVFVAGQLIIISLKVVIL